MVALFSWEMFETLISQMTTLVCFALKEEAAPFRKIAADGWCRSRPVSILLTGIGRKNAEKSVREFLATNATELVLTCGFAGGLNPDLQPGAVVVESADPEPQTPHSELQAKLLAAGAKPAKFFCAERIATTVAEKKQLRDKTGADAVEMESAAIHTVCRERGIPCATIRVISDTAGEDLPLDFNALAKPDQSIDFGKLAWAIGKSPGKISALMQLQKKTKFAAERLAEVLGQVL
jgi:adenosylhomocysteine nucleosidase